MKIKFLGTAGARFVVAKQLRASGGTLVQTEKRTFIIDPGPGTLARLAKSRPKIDVMKTDGVILSHIHLDHSNDANIVIDAFTQGGLSPKGFLFTTKEALYGESRVILPYLTKFLNRIETFSHKEKITEGDFEITPFRHKHTAETYGLKIKSGGKTVSFVIDTLFFEDLKAYYEESDILIINCVRFEPKEGIMHLSAKDAEELIKAVKPKKAILTHFGMTMLRAKPFVVASEMSERTGIEVIAASDGMSLEI